MQWLKSVGILCISLATSVTAWGLWTLAANRIPTRNETSERMLSALENSLDTSTKPTIYAIRAVGIPVGYAFFDASQNHLEIWLLELVGRSKATHTLKYSVEKMNSSDGSAAQWKITGTYQRSLQQRPLTTEDATWILTPGQTPSLALESGGFESWQGISAKEPTHGLPSMFEGAFPWPFLPLQDGNGAANQNTSNATIFFNPFSAQLEEEKRETSESDPFPTRLFLRLELFNRIPLDLTILTPESALSFISTLEGHAVSLEHLSSQNTLSSDLQKLETESQKCIDQTNEIHKKIVKKLPNAPYLLLRKTTLLKSFCDESLGLARFNRSALSTSSLAQDMSQKIRRTLQHEDAELPRSMALSPELNVLFDDTKHPLWLRSMSEMIKASLEEIEDTVEFESERKVPVRLKVTLKGKSLGTVVKGVIKGKDLSVSTNLVIAEDPEMLSTALLDTPSSATMEDTKNNIPHIGGITLNKQDHPLWQELAGICESSHGQIGIDLGNPRDPRSIQAEQGADHLWEDSRKIRILDRFLRRTMLGNSCTTISIRAPRELRTSAEKLQSVIEREVIQSMQEIQLKNSRYRYLQLLPGTYELYVSALISGELLEKFEFTVESKSKKQRGQQVLLSVMESGAQTKE